MLCIHYITYYYYNFSFYLNFNFKIIQHFVSYGGQLDDMVTLRVNSFSAIVLVLLGKRRALCAF